MHKYSTPTICRRAASSIAPLLSARTWFRRRVDRVAREAHRKRPLPIRACRRDRRMIRSLRLSDVPAATIAVASKCETLRAGYAIRRECEPSVASEYQDVVGQGRMV